jgi:hypothetical protein
MSPFKTVLLSGVSLFMMSIFSAMAWFFVNRYMPKVMERIDKHFKNGKENK